MNQMGEKSKLLSICFVDGTLIGKMNLNGPNGTYLHYFKLFKGYSENSELRKIMILNQGTDYIGFSQKQYIKTIQKGLSRAFNQPVEFKQTISKANKRLRQRK